MTADDVESQNNNKNIFFLFIAFMTLLIGAMLIKYLQPKKSQKERDAEGFTREDRIIQATVWNTYAVAKLSGIPLDNQTKLFFGAIGTVREAQFKSSTSQIIQFGICTGDYVTEVAEERKRKVIGYDYSPFALASASSKGADVRLVNLNATDSDHRLAYQAQLESDFSEISDVFLICILEYLKPEAVQLLLISMMSLAKPGSRFYFEIVSPEANVTDPSGQVTVVHTLKPGTISSFFNGKNNFRIEELDNTRKPDATGSTTLERLLVQKVSA